ncbi:MAG: hypothetical protein NNA24_00215 [Nitrospira sp.]|nr:hypothetical protein [Nitrospira sp.]
MRPRTARGSVVDLLRSPVWEGRETGFPLLASFPSTQPVFFPLPLGIVPNLV